MGYMGYTFMMWWFLGLSTIFVKICLNILCEVISCHKNIPAIKNCCFSYLVISIYHWKCGQFGKEREGHWFRFKKYQINWRIISIWRKISNILLVHLASYHLTRNISLPMRKATKTCVIHLVVKFSFSENATKICPIFLMVLIFTK